MWLRHNLQTKPLRLKRFEKWVAENAWILTESQVQALETAKEEEEATGSQRATIRVTFKLNTPATWDTSRKFNLNLTMLMTVLNTISIKIS